MYYFHPLWFAVECCSLMNHRNGSTGSFWLGHGNTSIPLPCDSNCSSMSFSICMKIWKNMQSSLIMHLNNKKFSLLCQVILLLGYGPDTPPRKLFLHKRCDKIDDNASSDRNCHQGEAVKQPELANVFSWRPVNLFLLWTIIWSLYVLVLCGIYVKQYGGLGEMFRRYEFRII